MKMEFVLHYALQFVKTCSKRVTSFWSLKQKPKPEALKSFNVPCIASKAL